MSFRYSAPELMDIASKALLSERRLSQIEIRKLAMCVLMEALKAERYGADEVPRKLCVNNAPLDIDL